MQIRFVQSGGLAGLVREARLDTAGLDPDEAAQVEGLVRDSGITASGAQSSPRGRDLHQYDLTLEDAGGRVQATFDDGTLPAAARPLVAYLKRLARPARAPR